ncbi:MAG: 4Fe-4S dicluster domain-containing protein [Caldilineaceae bacterium SB0670_bin_27]|uniref:Glycolate oxidase iron-sulfur subunit n=1 Tax=Caldilineaceae bacterium SB0664_bin_27 TaxID=2605260 RepID=A0A6B0YRB6_9CHLR|nr:4Fe-4S dicluster domain-containing protein [Caldilineaceae bacterium SB0664_bin_27]MYJ80178.1 4Fe-4S dicluster domain-containing protein [Caldilineaceae bacterium SB0670_bin_27]
MRHSIPVDSLGPQAPSMAEAVASCVHCGFCLPACPTYLALGEEMDSPRGRILLMKGALEGELSQEEVLPHVDRCLGCLACVTACPSGVEYGELLTPFREMTEKGRSRSPMEELTRTLTNQTLPYPGRFRAAAVMGRLTRIFKPFLPAALRTMLDLLPEKLPPRVALPPISPAQGKRRARVALLSGCVQQVLTPGINRATVDVLTGNGVEVVIPPRQGCCGALSMHTGAADQARALARRNFEAFNLSEVDAVVTNAAGCGSGMHEYPLLFAGEAEEQAARDFAGKVQDVTVFLDALGIEPPPALPAPMTVAYHDACHLAHAQGVTDAPRRLLGAVPNLTLVPIPEGEICCGSAGSYNIEQPEIAAQLGQRKAEAILGTGAHAVVTGNIGCMTQIDSHLQRLGKHLPVYHTVEFLNGSQE